VIRRPVATPVDDDRGDSAATFLGPPNRTGPVPPDPFVSWIRLI
jgi:hypothetical protein